MVIILTEEFSTFDIIKALKIPRERLRDWMVRKFIVPTTKAQGPGTKAIFTREDVYAVALFQNLIQRGFKRKEASSIVKNWLHYDALADFSFLFFRYKKSDAGLSHIHFGIAHELSDRPCWFDLKAGVVEPELQVDPWPQDEDWDYMFFINFKKIRKSIDAALMQVS